MDCPTTYETEEAASKTVEMTDTTEETVDEAVEYEVISCRIPPEKWRKLKPTVGNKRPWIFPANWTYLVCEILSKHLDIPCPMKFQTYYTIDNYEKIKIISYCKQCNEKGHIVISVLDDDNPTLTWTGRLDPNIVHRQAKCRLSGTTRAQIGKELQRTNVRYETRLKKRGATSSQFFVGTMHCPTTYETDEAASETVEMTDTTEETVDEAVEYEVRSCRIPPEKWRKLKPTVGNNDERPWIFPNNWTYLVGEILNEHLEIPCPMKFQTYYTIDNYEKIKIISYCKQCKEKGYIVIPVLDDDNPTLTWTGHFDPKIDHGQAKFRLSGAPAYRRIIVAKKHGCGENHQR